MGVAHEEVCVSEDATLDAFAESEPAEESAESDGASTADEVAPVDGEGESPDTVDPVVVTSTWTDTATCSDCGEQVPRLWRDADASVCAACKTWRASGEGPCDR